MADKFDLIVVGGGPGGYTAAIRAAQLGMKVACVEKRATLGGTCLNIGCIPSKALLQSSEKFELAKHHLGDHGIEVKSVGLDLAKMLARKDKVVEGTTKGIEFLFRKNKVTWIKGAGKLTGPTEVAVTGDGAAQQLTAPHIVIATGSEVTPLPGVAIDEKSVVSSTGALLLDKVPEHFVVVGGGYIGLEMGSVWRRLGAKVTVVEFLDRITPTMDQEVGRQLQKTLAKQGMEFKLSTKVTSAKQAKKGVTLTLEPAAGGSSETLDCDIVLAAIGRRPYTAGLGLEDLQVVMERGRIKVDGHFRSSV